MTGDSGTGTGEELGGIKKTFDWSGVVPEGVVCPACWGELSADAGALVCVGCGLRYPLVDGIPVLIVERAESDPSA
jgi:hypothetical protein